MGTTTTAAVIEEAGGEFVLSDVELDDLRDDEVLVKIAAAGLCHTDLTAQAGFIGYAFPGILGHEAAGVVEAVGSAVTRVAPGDHVALTFTSCGSCRFCRDGHPAYCASWVPANLFNAGKRTDGTNTVSRDGAEITGRFFGQSSFSKHAIADERSVVKIDDDLPLHVAAPLGCAVQTGAGTVMNILRPHPGTTIAVFGAGAVGLSAVMAAALTSATTIIAVDVVAHRLELARELGATATIDASSEDVAARVMELTGGSGLDYAVDTTANTTVTRTITDVLATFGTCAVVGAPPPGTELPVDISAFLVGRQLVGVTEGDSEPEAFIPTLAALYQSGRLPLDKIITTYKFDEINQAAADAHAGTAIKPVLVFD